MKPIYNKRLILSLQLFTPKKSDTGEPITHEIRIAHGSDDSEFLSVINYIPQSYSLSCLPLEVYLSDEIHITQVDRVPQPSFRPQQKLKVCRKPRKRVKGVIQ